MKFLASVKPQYVSLFIGSLSTQAVVSERLCILAEPTEFKTGSVLYDRSFSSFVALKPDMFEEYVVESIDNNRIFVEMNIGLLVKAMTVSKEICRLSLRLQQRPEGKILLLTIELSNSLILKQDIQVDVVGSDDVDMYKEPYQSISELSIQVDKAKELRGVLSRMKNVEKIVDIQADNHGTMSIKCSNVSVVMDTTFEAVQPINADVTRDIVVTIRLESKSLVHALLSLQVAPLRVVFGFDRNHLIVYVVLKDTIGSIKYYIPGLPM